MDNIQSRLIHKELLLEQVLKVITNDVAISLKEKQLNTVQDIIQAFETYRLARELQPHKLFKSDFSENRKSHQSSNNTTTHTKSNSTQNKPVNEPNKTNQKQTFNKPPRDLSKIQCFKCKEFGHLDRTCKNKFVPNKEVDEKAEKIKARFKKPDHKTHSSSFAIATTNNANFQDFCYSGKVENTPTILFKDTGSSCTLVHKSLIPETHYTGNYMSIGDISGNTRKYPEAEIVIQSSNGAVLRKVAVLEKCLPKIKVILGRDRFEILKENTPKVNINLIINASNIKTIFEEKDIDVLETSNSEELSLDSIQEKKNL